MDGQMSRDPTDMIPEDDVERSQWLADLAFAEQALVDAAMDQPRPTSALKRALADYLRLTGGDLHDTHG